jgi:hypothetical protein
MPTLANAKHEAVAQAYIADPERIGWRAYHQIYPNAAQHTAESAFSALMKKPEFSARIAELAEAAAQGAVMAAREVLVELSRIGRANMADFVRAFSRLRRSGGGGRPADAGADVGAGRGNRRAFHERPPRERPRGPPDQDQAREQDGW